MTELIGRDDPRFFEQTCGKSYDRHHYKIISSRHATFIVESWDEVQEWWWNHRQINPPVIEVLDKKKGFK